MDDVYKAAVSYECSNYQHLIPLRLPEWTVTLYAK